VKRNDVAIPAECLVCGATFNKLPDAVAKGRGCPECSRERSRVNPTRWMELAASLKFTWESGTPEGLGDKSKVARCLLCGQSWHVSPRALYRGSGHPRCPKVRTNTSQRVSFQEWQARGRKAGLEFLREPLNSKSKTPARCLRCGYEWSPVPVNVSSLGSGCPRCGQEKGKRTRGQTITLSESQQRAKLEEAAKHSGLEWLDIEQARSSKRADARCLKCSHSWKPWVQNVVSKGTSCPYCAGNLKLPQDVWEERAKSVGITLLSTAGGRHAQVIGRCVSCGKVSNFDMGALSSGHGCRDCGNKRGAELQRVQPSEWVARAAKHMLVWLEETGSNREQKLIQCQRCNYQWKVAPASLLGCPKCSLVVVSEEDWNRRASAVSARWLEKPKNARMKTLAECLSCGKGWRPTPDSIARGSGCPNCAETGFKPGESAYLYLIQDSVRGCRKIGISNLDDQKTRLRAHRANGFTEVVFVFEHERGELIARLETSVMAWIRVDLGLPQFLGRADMPQRGWTETFSMDGPTNDEIVDRIFLLLEDALA